MGAFTRYSFYCCLAICCFVFLSTCFIETYAHTQVEAIEVKFSRNDEEGKRTKEDETFLEENIQKNNEVPNDEHVQKELEYKEDNQNKGEGRDKQNELQEEDMRAVEERSADEKSENDKLNKEDMNQENSLSQEDKSAFSSSSSSSSSPYEAAPTFPVFPDKMNKLFLEATWYPIQGKHHTLGKYDYDFKAKKQLVVRLNGRYDKFCGLNGAHALKDTPCAHVVMNERRYLVYPKLKECCFCCDAAHGCGVLKPDWMEGAKFIRQIIVEMKNGKKVKANAWFKSAIPLFTYLEKVDDENKSGKTIPLMLYEMPHILKVFKDDKGDNASYSLDGEHNLDKYIEELHKIEKSMKEILDGKTPEWCKLDAPCSKMSACALAQRDDNKLKQEQQSQEDDDEISEHQMKNKEEKENVDYLAVMEENNNNEEKGKKEKKNKHEEHDDNTQVKKKPHIKSVLEEGNVQWNPIPDASSFTKNEKESEKKKQEKDNNDENAFKKHGKKEEESMKTDDTAKEKQEKERTNRESSSNSNVNNNVESASYSPILPSEKKNRSSQSVYHPRSYFSLEDIASYYDILETLNNDNEKYKIEGYVQNDENSNEDIYNNNDDQKQQEETHDKQTQKNEEEKNEPKKKNRTKKLMAENRRSYFFRNVKKLKKKTEKGDGVHMVIYV